MTAGTCVQRADPGAETTLGSLYAAGARDVSVWYMNEVQDRQAANTISMRLRSR